MLRAGGQTITAGGTVISLASGGSSIVVGGTKEALSVPFVAATLTGNPSATETAGQGLGGITTSLVGFAAPVSTRTANTCGI